MRKLFSLLTAVLFAGSMMAIDFTLSSAESVTKDGVTVTFAKGSGTTAPTWYDKGLRLYASNTVTISSESNITAISFNWEKQGSKAFNTVTASTGSYTHPTEAGVGAWTGSVTSVTFTLGATGQLQLNTFSVTVGEGGGETPGGDTPGGGVDPALVMTCAEAQAAAKAGSTAKATVRGYVTEIAYPWSSGSMSFWMADTKDGGQVFEAYKCECAEADAPAVGDLVQATGNLTVYKTTAELAAGCTVVIIEKASGDTPGGDTPGGDTPATDTLTCADARTLALGGNTDERIIKGYVTQYVSEWQEKFKNVSFWMADATDGGQVFEAFRVVCNTAEEAPVVGDLVWVKGNLTKYEKGSNVTPETAAGGSFGILAKSTIPVVDPVNLGEKTIAEFLELKNFKDTCVLTGVVSNIKKNSDGSYNKYGNFDITDATGSVYVYGLLTADGQTQKFQEMGVNEGDTLKIKAVYFDYNGTAQAKNAVFVEVKKTPADTITINMSEGLYFRDCVESEGWWQIYGDNAQYTVSISNVETTQAEGTYTINDLDADYTYVGIINGNDTNYVSFVDGSVTLSIAQNGDVTVAGQLVGEDGNIYNLNFVFVAPAVQETVSVVITDAELYDEYADSGLYGVYGTDANNVYVQLGIWAKNGLQGQFSDQDLDFQYVGSFIEEGENEVEIYSASITVTPGNNGSYNIEATILGYNNKQYNVTMYVPATASGIEETIATGKAVKTISNGMLLIEKAGVKYSVLGQTIR